MAVKVVSTYCKRLGLPGYSSHQFSVSVETELTNVEDVAAESARLYALLQESVDQQMQETGFVPPDTYGMTSGSNGHSSNGNGNGHHRQQDRNGAGISEKQIELITKIVNEHNLNKATVEQMAVDMFGNGVRALSRMQGSQLIDELFEKHGRGNGNGNGRGPARNNRFQRERVRQ